MAAPVFTKPATLVGHRGLGKGLVAGRAENSLESFLAAVASGLEWVELDVQRASDDELIVWHDPALPDGSYIADVPGEVGVRQGALRLRSLLEALPCDVGVVLDVKSSLRDAGRDPASTTGSVLARTCSRVLGDRPAVAVSFDPAALAHMRQEMPGLALGLLTWLRFPISHAVAAAAHLDVQVLAVHGGSLWPNASTTRRNTPPLARIVSDVHHAGRQLLVWCPAKRRVRPLIAAGVDAMVVDDVPAVVAAFGPGPSVSR